jgi:NAD(P)-dependent dehydrogenase (short-subunit alcohol dehydrogenase family)
LQGKTAVITGGTSGIGEIAAERLAQMVARIVLIARSKSRGKVTLARLHENAPDLAHTVHYADLTRVREMKRVAAEIASQEPRIDVLINNVGAMFANRRLTEDGLECTFALNHMAYFVITEELRGRLLASAPARIVSTASAAHQGARLDFDDLQLAKSFGSMKAYGRSKLCNILFTRELARRLLGTGSPPTACIPVSSRPASVMRAAARSRVSHGSPSSLRSLPKWVRTQSCISPPRRPSRKRRANISTSAKPSHRRQQDDRVAALLWERSAALVGLKA